jgi:hypothetical protein
VAIWREIEKAVGAVMRLADASRGIWLRQGVARFGMRILTALSSGEASLALGKRGAVSRISQPPAALLIGTGSTDGGF